MGGEEPAPRDGRSPRAGALPPPERQGAALLRERQPPLPRPQVGDADLLQRPGGDLPRLDGRARAGAGRPSPPRAPHRPALRPPPRPHHTHLHRGRALLRGAGVAGLPERRPAAVVTSRRSRRRRGSRTPPSGTPPAPRPERRGRFSRTRRTSRPAGLRRAASRPPAPPLPS